MAGKRKKKNSEDTLYHVIFWIIVIAIFPISLSVWFYRTKIIRLDKKTKRIVIAVFWALVAFLIALFGFILPKLQDRQEEKESSRQESSEIARSSSEQEAIKSSEEEEIASEISIRFLNMNQADAAIINCDGHYMIVDSGEVSVELSARLLETDLTEVDYLVATTPYNQSVGGFARAMTWFTVGKAYCSTDTYESDKFKDFTEALKEQKVTLKVPAMGETVDLGRAKVTFLGPVQKANGETGSLVIMIEHKNRRILLCGAAEAEELEALIQRGFDIDCDLIKIGNHGADGALSANVMAAASPDYAVISVGEGYGCPSDETLIYLKNDNVKTYRTDMQGDIDYKSTIDNLEMKAAHDEDADTLFTENSELPSPSESQDEPQQDTPAESDQNQEPGEQGEPQEQGEQGEPQPQDTQPPADTQPAEQPPADTQPAEQPPAETQPAGPPEEAVPDANGYTYAKKVTDNYFHRLNCPEIAGMTYPQLEKYNVSRATMMNEWRTLIPCPVCNP